MTKIEIRRPRTLTDFQEDFNQPLLKALEFLKICYDVGNIETKEAYKEYRELEDKIGYVMLKATEKFFGSLSLEVKA